MRVVIADDEVLLREGLERLLLEAGFDVVGKVGTADELRRKVELARPDVVIVDIRMPPYAHGRRDRRRTGTSSITSRDRACWFSPSTSSRGTRCG